MKHNMSTKCKLKVSNTYPASQVQAEIKWLDQEIEKVKEQMERKPSKIRHLNDLIRQREERIMILTVEAKEKK